MQHIESHRDLYTISTDPARLDVTRIHRLLNQYSYWAQNRPLELVQKTIANSLSFGVYGAGGELVGYARVVTDYATFAWLCDVIVDPEHRGRGLARWLVECVVDHPDLKMIRRILLATRDAHNLYRNYGGFEILDHPERWMERFNPTG